MQPVEIKGVMYCPCCGRKMPNNIEQTVMDFIEASNVNDWIDQPTEDVYKIYWKWCVKHSLDPANKIVFVRTVLSQYPDIKSKPMKGKRYFRKSW